MWSGEGPRNVLFIAPPGTAKSTYISIGAIDYYIGMHPDHNLLFLTASDVQAKKFTGVMKASLIDNKARERYFSGTDYEPDYNRGWSNDGLYLKGMARNNKDPNYAAYGYGSHIIGARAHGIILDDPITQKASNSVLEMQEHRSYLDGTVLSRLHPDGWVMAIMTRWSQKDLAEHLMNKEGWHVVLLPALIGPDERAKVDSILSFTFSQDSAQASVQFEPQKSSGEKISPPLYIPGSFYRNEDQDDASLLTKKLLVPSSSQLKAAYDKLGGAPGFSEYISAEEEEEVSIWPGRFTKAYYEALRLDDPALFGCLYQGDPTAAGGDHFRAEWFKPLPAGLELSKLRIVQFWDTAFSESKIADYSSCVTIGVDEDRNIYLLHVLNERLSPARLVTRMVEMIEMWQPHLVGVERPAFRQRAVRDIVDQVNRQTMRTIRDIAPEGDKIARAKLPAGRAESGKFYVNMQATWWPQYLKQLVGFPNMAHDDMVDATSGAVKLAAQSRVQSSLVETPYTIEGATPKRKRADIFSDVEMEPVFVTSDGRRVAVGTP